MTERVAAQTRKLVVNADDFGFTRDVNRGIVEAHRDGILTATTLMATGSAFDDAVRLAKENPTLDIGCHLVLVGSPGFPESVAQLALSLGRIRVYDELAAQVQRILDAGLHPTHLDTHKHTHLLPPVLDAVARISQEFSIPWVRRPFDFPLEPGGVSRTKRAVSAGFGIVRGRFGRVLARHGCRSTDHFAGFKITGNFDGAGLAMLIRSLPEGSTEFMCHPGRCTDELRAQRTRLKESREQELRALTSPEVRAALTRIRPWSWSTPPRALIGGDGRSGRVNPVHGLLDQSVDHEIPVEPGEARVRDQQRGEPMNGGPDGLRRGFEIRDFEMTILDALRQRAAKMIERFLSHGVGARAALQIVERVGHHEGDFVVIGVLQPELDVGAKAAAQTLDRIGDGLIEGVLLAHQAAQRLLANAIEQIGLVLKI